MGNQKLNLRRSLATAEDVTRLRESQQQMPMQIQNAVVMDDQYDVAHYMAHVHGRIEHISDDYTLGDLTNTQRDAITKLYAVALVFEQTIPDKNVGTRLRNYITAQTDMTVIMARNKGTNNLVKWILNVPQNEAGEEQEAKKQSVFEKFKSALTGGTKKKKKETEEEDA